MKKILSLIFAVILISSCFAFTAFAEDVVVPTDDITYTEKITFSEDFQKLYVDGEPCSRIDASMLDVEFAPDGDWVDLKENGYYWISVELSETQKETVKEVAVCPDSRNVYNAYNVLYSVRITFNDSSVLSTTFLKDTHLEEYEKIVSGDWEEYVIDFEYPTGNTVTAQKSYLFGEAVIKNDNQLSIYDWYPVKVQNSDKSLVAHKGFIFIDGDEYYYLDSAENGVEGYYWYETGFGDVPDFTVHKITDEALIAELAVAEQRYYEDDYGYLYNDDTTDTVSAIFLIFVFAVIPAVIFVIFLIKAIRGKGVYQKIYGAVAALCIAELAVFTIIAVIISNLN